MFEQVYNVFSLTDRDKMVERTGAWSFCLQKRMFLKIYVFEDKMSMYRSV